MTLYEAFAIVAFVWLLARPSLRADSIRNPIGTVIVSALWPAALAAVGYYLVKVRVFGRRALGRHWVMDVEIVGFLLVMLLFILAFKPMLQHRVF